jgi:hypothetical protein
MWHPRSGAYADLTGRKGGGILSVCTSSFYHIALLLSVWRGTSVCLSVYAVLVTCIDDAILVTLYGTYLMSKKTSQIYCAPIVLRCCPRLASSIRLLSPEQPTNWSNAKVLRRRAISCRSFEETVVEECYGLSCCFGNPLASHPI